jgi:glucans biosynthesis protein
VRDASRRDLRTRRAPSRAIALAWTGIVALVCSFASSARGFGLEDVALRAQKLATHSYEDPAGSVPRWLLDIRYDEWRDIRFRTDRALWKDKGLPFSVQFFHLGHFYDRAVRVNVVTPKGVAPFHFTPDLFDYGKNEFGSRVPQDLGFAGFRLHYPIKTKTYQDEVIVFLGASYLRAVGRDEGFGLSARGLAIDTALPSGEEFPWFREYWLVEPSKGATSMTLYALLDSPSATGAYQFVVTPGVETRVDVSMRVFARDQIAKVGIAPLTSMFFHGENTVGHFDDYRPEVHDSDGLLVAADGGEWLWRPLENPNALRLALFNLTNPRGFGLMQRDRNLDHYQDLEARPDLRPTAWVEPKGDWGEGHVELVEIPSRNETNDNVVAYWVPSIKPTPTVPLSLAYALYWYGDDSKRPPGGRVIATRRDSGTFENGRRLVVDFESPTLRALPADAVVQGVVTIAGGSAAQGRAEMLEQQMVRNPVTGSWRLVFQIRPLDNDPIELRAFLRHGENVLTETWSYLLVP